MVGDRQFRHGKTPWNARLIRTSALAVTSLGIFVALTSPDIAAQQLDEGEAEYDDLYGLSNRPTFSLYGTPGLIDMPTAYSAPEGELAFTSAYMGKQLRNTGYFQVTNRFSAAFRYTVFEDAGNSDKFDGNVYDQSFDIGFRFLDENRYRPAMTLGMRDILGTGRLSAEYIAATKRLHPSLTATAGIGWGRLGTYNGFTNPLAIFGDSWKTRPPPREEGDEEGGKLSYNTWFRGDAAFFGGIEWRPTERLSVKAEYSSDAYLDEVAAGTFDRKSPFSFGANYRLGKNADIAAYYAYGSSFGLQLTLATNPGIAPYPSGLDNAPTPVLPRPNRSSNPQAWSSNWFGDSQAAPALRTNLETVFESEGLEVQDFQYGPNAIQIRYLNPTYPSEAQAIGRAARALTRGLPNSIETITLIPVVNGLESTAVTLQRSDIERLENSPDATWEIYAAARFEDALSVQDLGPTIETDLFPRYNWGLGPYVRFGFFDPDQPLRFDIGAELSGSYEPSPGWLFAGAIRKRIIGNLDESNRPSDSLLPPVRTDYALYDKFGDPELTYLTGEYFFRPATDWYGRVSVGYLEEYFAGISAEALWNPTSSRFAVGAELNHVRQRDFDQWFGLLDYNVTTGYLSGYYQFSNGFFGQLDVGSYLAGDVGATFSLFKTWGNGWKVGGFATKTNVSSEEFGEGSFDKGIYLEIPLSWAIGKPNTFSQKATLRPVQRDGGQRMNIRNRLYDVLEERNDPNLSDQWGRFWR